LLRQFLVPYGFTTIMAQRIWLFVLLLPFLLQLKAQTPCQQAGLEKALYVDQFLVRHPASSSRINFNKSILGNPKKEEALLFFAQENKFTYLILYGAIGIFQSNNGDIRLGLEAPFQNFVHRANALGIKIGLAVGSKEMEAIHTAYPTAKEAIQHLKTNRQNSDSLSLFGQFKSLIQFQQTVKKKTNQTGGVLPKDAGIYSLVTENEWWHGTLQEADAAFRKKFLPLLRSLQLFKQANVIQHIDSYLGYFPVSDNSRRTKSYHQKWVKALTQTNTFLAKPGPLVDRVLLVNYTRFPSQIFASSRFQRTLQAFSSFSYFPMPFIGLFETSSSAHIDSDDLQFYNDVFLGDLFANQSESLYSIQHLFQERYATSNFSNVQLAGFGWFKYSEMPHTLFLKNSPAKKYRMVDQKQGITDELVNYFPTTDSATLYTHCCGTLSGDTLQPRTLIWKTAATLLSPNEMPPHTTNNQNLSITTTASGFHWIVTSGPQACSYTSPPIHLQFPGGSLAIANGTEGHKLNTPSIWINQDSLSAKPGYPLYHAKNYIHIQIKNTGTSTNSGMEMLDLYFAKASIQPQWPSDWMNEDDENGKPIGNRINLRPLFIPPIAPGDSIQLSLPWSDLNRTDGDGIGLDWPENSNPQLAERLFYLYARIESSEHQPPQYEELSFQQNLLANPTSQAGKLVCLQVDSTSFQNYNIQIQTLLDISKVLHCCFLGTKKGATHCAAPSPTIITD